MSSLVRRIQRKGSRMGAPTRADALDLLARLAREEKRRGKEKVLAENNSGAERAS